MTPAKIIKVIDRYTDMLIQCDILPVRNIDESADRIVQLKHIGWMCLQIADMVEQGKVEKAMRWLGFVQGVLWSTDFRTVDDLRRDNMPDGEEFQERKTTDQLGVDTAIWEDGEE